MGVLLSWVPKLHGFDSLHIYDAFQGSAGVEGCLFKVCRVIDVVTYQDEFCNCGVAITSHSA